MKLAIYLLIPWNEKFSWINKLFNWTVVNSSYLFYSKKWMIKIWCTHKLYSANPDNWLYIEKCKCIILKNSVRIILSTKYRKKLLDNNSYFVGKSYHQINIEYRLIKGLKIKDKPFSHEHSFGVYGSGTAYLLYDCLWKVPCCVAAVWV